MPIRVFVVCLCLAGTESLAASPVVVSYGDSGYHTSTAVPFSIGPGFSVRYQQVYEASIFAPIAPYGGGWITAIGFRFEPPGPPLSIGFVTSVQIDFSTTPRAPDGLSTNFVDNIGPDNMVVLGPFTTGFAAGDGPLGAAGFPVVLPLEPAFFYNPAEGNLLMDVRTIQTSSAYPVPFFSGTSQSGDPVSRITGDDVNNSSGRASTTGLDTGFLITPIPEPGSVVVFCLGVVVLGFWVSWQQRNTSTQKGRTWR